MIRPSNLEVTIPCGVVQVRWDDFEIVGSSVVIAPRGPGVAGCNSGWIVADVGQHRHACTGLF
jgi:hypothetical protein